MYDRFIQTLAMSGRLVLYDKPGWFLDPVDPDSDLYDQLTDVYLAVLDALDADRAWVVDSRPAANVMTIRTNSDRVLGLGS